MCVYGLLALRCVTGTHNCGLLTEKEEKEEEEEEDKEEEEELLC